MILKRLSRALVAGSISGSLVVALLVTPLVTLAATPAWTGTLVALPQRIEDGYTAGYEATVFNPGPSNIAQLYVQVQFSEPYVAGTDTGTPPTVVEVKLDGVDVTSTACGSAPYSAPLMCSLGALRAGAGASLLVAYPTTGTGDAGVTVDWTTTGLGTGDDNSHGDVLHQFFNADNLPTQISTSGNVGGGFVQNKGTQVSNDAINGVSNQVSTTVIAPAKNIAVTVADEGGVQNDPGCPSGFTCVLGTSQIQVGDGSNAYGFFNVVITVDKTLSKGVNLSKVVIFHQFDNGDLDPNPIPVMKTLCSGTTRCANLFNIPGGHSQFSIYIPENGFIKFH